jgi:hypothetical protein
MELSILSLDDDKGFVDQLSLSTVNTFETRAKAIKPKQYGSMIPPQESSLQKTLQRFYRKKFMGSEISSDNSSCSYIEFFVPGASTFSVAPAANENCDGSFASTCWDSFQFFVMKHREENPHLSDDCIPVTKLGKAMQKIIFTIAPDHVNSVAEYFGLLDDRNVTLSWDDFKQFVNQILETMPLNTTLISSPDETNAKQKCSSTQISQHASRRSSTEIPALASSSPPKDNKVIYLSSMNILHGQNASKNFAKEEMIDIFRREEHFKRLRSAEEAETGEMRGLSILGLLAL